MNRLLLLASCALSTLPSAVRGQPPDRAQPGWADVLQQDPRLQAPVTFKFKSRPAPREVFERLQGATGVPLSLADAAEGDAVFGSMTVFNVPAWRVMSQLAGTQVRGGKWEKTGDGYVLHGAPREFPASDGTRPAAGSSHPGLLVAMGVLGGLVAGLCLLRFLRGPSKKAN